MQLHFLTEFQFLASSLPALCPALPSLPDTHLHSTFLSFQTSWTQIVVSQSDGALAIWRPHPNGGAPVQEVAPWHAHTLRGGVPTEAWISFFRKRGAESEPGCGGGGEIGASLVVSGADDALMKGWDLRSGGGACGASPAFVCKDHGAGVTAGQWHPTLEHAFVRYVRMQPVCRENQSTRSFNSSSDVISRV